MLFRKDIAASYQHSRKHLVWLDTCGLFSSGILGALRPNRTGGEEPQSSTKMGAVVS